MAVNDSILNEHKIKFVCIGKLQETALEVKNDAEQQIGKKEDGKIVKCKQLTGKISVDTGSGVVVLFPQFNEIGYDGKEASRWKMALSMLDWNPKIKGDSKEPVTRVMLEGELNYYDGRNKSTNKVELKKSYRITRASTTVPDTLEDGFSFEGDFYIDGVSVNDDTGVGTIKAYYSNYRGEIIPVDFTVDPDDVDIVFEGDSDFEAIEAGQTRNLKISYYRTMDDSAPVVEVQTRKFGSSRKEAPDVPTHSRYKDEYVLTSASSAPVEEPEEEYDDEGNLIDNNSVWYNPVTIKKAKKARAQKLEEMEKNPPEKKSGASGLKEAKANAKAGGNKFGNKPRQVAPTDDAPFDLDDDDLF